MTNETNLEALLNKIERQIKNVQESISDEKKNISKIEELDILFQESSQLMSPIYKRDYGILKQNIIRYNSLIDDAKNIENKKEEEKEENDWIKKLAKKKEEIKTSERILKSELEYFLIELKTQDISNLVREKKYYLVTVVDVPDFREIYLINKNSEEYQKTVTEIISKRKEIRTMNIVTELSPKTIAENILKKNKNAKLTDLNQKTYLSKLFFNQEENKPLDQKYIMIKLSTKNQMVEAIESLENMANNQQGL